MKNDSNTKKMILSGIVIGGLLWWWKSGKSLSGLNLGSFGSVSPSDASSTFVGADGDGFTSGSVFDDFFKDFGIASVGGKDGGGAPGSFEIVIDRGCRCPDDPLFGLDGSVRCTTCP